MYMERNVITQSMLFKYDGYLKQFCYNYSGKFRRQKWWEKGGKKVVSLIFFS